MVKRIKTRSLYLTRAWIGNWTCQTDRHQNGQNCLS